MNGNSTEESQEVIMIKSQQTTKSILDETCFVNKHRTSQLHDQYPKHIRKDTGNTEKNRVREEEASGSNEHENTQQKKNSQIYKIAAYF